METKQYHALYHDAMRLRNKGECLTEEHRAALNHDLANADQVQALAAGQTAMMNGAKVAMLAYMFDSPSQ